MDKKAEAFENLKRASDGKFYYSKNMNLSNNLVFKKETFDAFIAFRKGRSI